jgi:hypothetical protein
MPDVTRLAKDALYVTVGLGVLAFQKAQVRRRELQERFAAQSAGARQPFESVAKLVEERVRTLEERLEGVEERFDAVLDQIEQRLPEPARELSQQARKAAKQARGQMRQLAGRPSSAA